MMIRSNNIYLIISLILFIGSLIYTNNIFILLTTFLFPGSLLSNKNINNNIFNFNIFFLEFCLLFLFSCEDLISFYIYFEASLIPLFIIIVKFGGKNSQRAAYLLFLYTLLGSLFILVGFLLLYQYTNTFYIIHIRYFLEDHYINHYIYFFILISLVIKTPIIPLHIWLSRAHAEASISNSIILAGLILKIATFGYLRLLLDIMPIITIYYSNFLEILAIISLFYSSLSCLRQIDIKIIIALSSIAHISIVILGLFSNNLYGLYGGLLLSIGHGLISPILFFIVGGILYDRFHTRILRYYRGLSLRIPLISIFIFISILGNLGLPLTINFLGEFLSLLGLFQHNLFYGCLSTFTVVFSASYSLWLFCRINFGSFSNYLNYASDLNRREFHILFPWLILTIFFGIHTIFFNYLLLNQSYNIINNLVYLLY